MDRAPVSASTARPIFRPIGIGGGGALYYPVIDPSDPDTAYTGSDIGGIYRTRDGGRSWEAINDGILGNPGFSAYRYGVSAIAIRPDNSRKIFAGAGRQIYFSDSGGETWHGIGGGLEKSAGGFLITQILIDPSKPKRMYFSLGDPEHMIFKDKSTRSRRAGPRVFRSDDEGRTWTPASRGIDLNSDARSILLMPGRKDTLLVSTDRGVYFSQDAGETWVKRSSGLPRSEAGMLAAGVDPVTGKLMIYVTVNTKKLPVEGWVGGVYRSVDEGRAWSKASAGLSIGKVSKGGRVQRFFALAVDPEDGKKVYVGAARYSPEAGIFMSADGGVSWKRVTRGPPPLGNVRWGWIRNRALWISGIAIWPKDPKIIYATTTQGLFRSDDGGEGWYQIFTDERSGNFYTGRGHEETGVHDIAFDLKDPKTFYAAFEDNRLIRTFDGGASFNPTGWPELGCDADAVEIDPDRRETIYVAAHCGPGQRGGVFRSRDKGRRWEQIGGPDKGIPSPLEPQPRSAAQFLEIDPASPLERRTLLLTSYGNGVFRSTDGGKNWRPANHGLPAANRNASFLIGANRVYYLALRAGTPRRSDVYGGAYWSADAGASWHKLNTGTDIPTVLSISIHPTKKKTLLVTALDHLGKARKFYPGGIYRTSDGGRTWNHIFDFPQVEHVVFDPLDENTLYALAPDETWMWRRWKKEGQAFRPGIYRSTDGGETWEDFSGNVGRYHLRLKWLRFSPHGDRTVYLGTHGGGLLRAIFPAPKRPVNR